MDGPVVVDFDYPKNGSKGCVSAKPEITAQIAKSPTDFYVNVHTDKFKGGAICGQLEK